MSTYYTGVNNLLAPENCTLILIDHQPLQFAGVQNIDETLLVNNVVGLAKTAKVFGVPTILTTVLDVFPDQKPINRTTLNTWEDERVVDAVKKIGRKKLVIASRTTRTARSATSTGATWAGSTPPTRGSPTRPPTSGTSRTCSPTGS